jgi:hypothetical protein
MKIRRVGAELFEPGGRTDRHDEANSRFSKSCGPDALNKCNKNSNINTCVELYMEETGEKPPCECYSDARVAADGMCRLHTVSIVQRCRRVVWGRTPLAHAS